MNQKSQENRKKEIGEGNKLATKYIFWKNKEKSDIHSSNSIMRIKQSVYCTTSK